MLTPNFTPFPTLTTPRLILRKITTDDVPELLIIRSDERIMKYIDRPRAKTNDDVIAFINLINNYEKNNDAINWAISLKDDPKLIGNVCFWRIEKSNYRAEIGYTLHPDHWHKGIMNEVIKEVINYGFNIMKLHSIEANINPANEASAKLLEKNKFVREAYLKENYFFEGKFLDSVIYSLLEPKK
ncbi:MAG TPA: GNAT family protein [Bacteroidia bacterium]|jgi:ribosomal-protein-alanine N-acetyltransferase|nr:GNAT family protein [Bacteroidia bacterium]